MLFPTIIRHFLMNDGRGRRLKKKSKVRHIGEKELKSANFQGMHFF